MQILKLLPCVLCASCVLDFTDSRTSTTDNPLPSTTGMPMYTGGDSTTSYTYTDSTGAMGATSTGGGGASSTSGGGGIPVCTKPAQIRPYGQCEGLCDGACAEPMECMVDNLESVNAALCVESCTVGPEGIVGCSPTMKDPPWDAPICQNFRCAIACVDGACPVEYSCIQVSAGVDICMPAPLM